MRRSQKKASPLPAGWFGELQDKADLQHSYDALGRRKHFYVEAFRGNLKTNQLQFGTAWEHFDRARELSLEAEEDIPNLVRQFLLNIWCFECALLEAPLAESRGKVPPLWLPELPEEILTGSRTLNRAITAGLLHGLYSYMEDHEQARDWAAFIQSLDCPQATKDLSLRRGSVAMERCAARSELLVL